MACTMVYATSNHPTGGSSFHVVLCAIAFLAVLVAGLRACNLYLTPLLSVLFYLTRVAPTFARVPASSSAEGRWTLDWKAMEAAMKEHPETALLMLCNPYNPVGETKA